jgi:hypothetical protein
MPDTGAVLDRLHMMRGDLRRVERSVRILRQQVARSIEELEAALPDDSRGGTRTNEHRNRTEAE